MSIKDVITSPWFFYPSPTYASLTFLNSMRSPLLKFYQDQTFVEMLVFWILFLEQTAFEKKIPNPASQQTFGPSCFERALVTLLYIRAIGVNSH
jgi:hypothetical protein